MHCFGPGFTPFPCSLHTHVRACRPSSRKFLTKPRTDIYEAFHKFTTDDFKGDPTQLEEVVSRFTVREVKQVAKAAVGIARFVKVASAQINGAASAQQGTTPRSSSGYYPRNTP